MTAPAQGRGKGVRLAALQLEPVFGEKELNTRTSMEQTERAADAGAEMVVLPELSNTGYCLNDYKEALALGEDGRSGPTIKSWTRMAQRCRLYIVGGFLERSGYCLYNSAAVVGPEGVIGVYRKTHLFDREKLFFRPGNAGLPVFQLPFGRVGVLICYDLRFCETVRILTLLGADLICVPTNWVLSYDARVDGDFVMQNYVVMTAANVNQVFIACASRVGVERDTEFLGRSLIVGPAGWPLAGPGSADMTEMLIADLELGESTTNKIKSCYNDILRDRRVDLYGDLLGYSAEKSYPF